ncbi:serpin family protein [Nakamurella silvestris]|nr:serpin family protein [Nakamurella silvestris]
MQPPVITHRPHLTWTPNLSGVAVRRSRQRNTVVAVLAVMSLLTAGCGSAGEPQAAPTPVLLSPGEVQPLRSEAGRGPAADPVEAGKVMTAWGTAVLAEVDRGTAEANIVLSPYSVYSVLAMAGQGAAGTTADQLNEALGGDPAGQQRNVTAVDAGMASALAAAKEFDSLVAGENVKSGERPAAGSFSLEVANSLWARPGLGIRQEFLDALAAGFGVGMYETDFAADPEKARAVINGWVSERTGKLIPELIPENGLSADTVLALVNAVHLRAAWAQELSSPVAEPFQTPTGPVQAKMMSSFGGFGFVRGADWQSVSIPYQGGGLAMTLVLPAEGGWDRVGADLAAVISAATASTTSGYVRLRMPQFTVDTAANLTSAMEALGVTDLFDSSDLSGIAGEPGKLRVSNLIHRAVISVDEHGTEAAAATALLTTEEVSAPEVDLEITFDRPFYFVVHDTTTNAPLFIGQITNPVV